MDIWLDDKRIPPKGEWTWVKTFDEALWELAHNPVEAISLDNDLGEGETEGWEVLRFMENDGFWPGLIGIHSSNNVRVKWMKDTIMASGLYGQPLPIFYTTEYDTQYPATVFVKR
jgi:hypothetical protein